MDGWRWTWATGGFVLFGTFLANAINRSPTTSSGTLALDWVLAFIGLVIVAVAMARPNWLLGHKKAEEEEKERRRKEREHAAQLDNDQRRRDFMTPDFQTSETRAINRLMDFVERKFGDDDADLN